MKNNIAVDKSFHFAIRIIKLSKYLNDKKKEYLLSKQILRSGTSIGANIEEAIAGRTKKEFINIMTIAYKESRETKYWLKLLKETDFIEEKIFQFIIPRY